MSPIARMMDEAHGPARPEARPPAAAARGRRKLWDLPSHWHCPLIGTCLPVAELRHFSKCAGLDLSDYMLHTAVVGECGKRGEVARYIQRFLDDQYAVAVRRFAEAKGEQAVLALWREALAAGNVAGALWAAWSHADLSEDGGSEIYGDIHMLSHQIGASMRADLRRLAALEKDNARLREEAATLRLGLGEAQRLRDRDVAELEKRLAAAEGHAARLARDEAEWAAARRATAGFDALKERADAFVHRAQALEESNAASAGRIAGLEAELADARAELGAAGAALEAALCGGVSADVFGCGRASPAETQLAGRCVLCIGGRPGLVEAYRRLVEAGGGRFRHHDGGQEESLHRLDAILAGADAVVCQAGCISHAAYWRLKEACKKLGKPCVFLKSPGVTSFARGLAELAGSRGGIPD